MAYLPPYADVLGATVEETPDGPILRMPYAPPVLGRPGFLHGGAIAGLLEIAAIAAIVHLFGEQDRPQFKPINVTVDFMRGGRDHDTFAAARVTRLGNRVANIEAHAWQEDRAKPIAAARMHMMLDR